MARRGTNIYHRADGRWEGRHYIRGSRKYKSVYGKSYTEARIKLDRLRNEVLVPSARCSLLTGDILKMWLESRRPRIKESSYASYRYKLEKHLLPYFGDLKYSCLTAAVLEQFIAEKVSAGLSGKYISDMVVLVKNAAKWAEITHGYADLIRNVALPKTVRKETVVFSHDEQKRLLNTINNDKSGTSCGVLLTLFTGLRIGELCALQWGDIDFCSGVLHVRKTVQRIATYGTESKSAVRISSPKSATSIRDIPLPPFLIKMLAPYRRGQGDYIVSGGKAVTEPRTFTNRYKALLRKAAVPSLKFHSLRHTFATNALQQSFDVKTLSELLGHSSANITMRVYIHSSMERKAACMNRLSALI
ncbi:MAG: site-specific integrase [Clostridia bacterium]|nr:site-specific integrase [Clostridia bacterium]